MAKCHKLFNVAEGMYTLTAADFADTGQWRLWLNIGCTGLEAYLENTLHPEIPRQHFCSVSWPQNRDMLRHNIEEAVYGNPGLLDDFATRIIIYDPRSLFIPTELAEETSGAEEKLYKKVYTAETADIMTDSDRDLTVAWELAPGVKSFLMRTFPGARITCNLMEKVRRLRNETEMLTLYVQARQKEVDILLLDGSSLLSASTHEWNHTDDIAFLVLNLLDVYGKKIADTKIVPDGVEIDTEAWRFISDKSKSFLSPK